MLDRELCARARRPGSSLIAGRDFLRWTCRYAPERGGQATCVGTIAFKTGGGRLPSAGAHVGARAWRFGCSRCGLDVLNEQSGAQQQRVASNGLEALRQATSLPGLLWRAGRTARLRSTRHLWSTAANSPEAGGIAGQ